ncbi:hypothetical protein AK812_SmicGene2323 [Symbiodinium microadriaticum]|uniref:Uncharacterized protein n=1 Tax=Symbiodinium microadriaticum TaxID=2951 RepID=A0A1Q9F1X7_SYMMI|nr:hypothetical protein AK812_SmicGene2323 [Symbiodinium microadriaticum]
MANSAPNVQHNFSPEEDLGLEVSKSLSSLSVLDVIEEPSIQSNDAAMVAARALGFKGFDAAQAAPADVQTQAAIRLRGKLRSKELAQLRQLVEGDERFARLLERHCKAIHELIALGNPAPVLAVLAGLVWSSLSIAWELDTSHMPKARMKNEIEQLKVKLQKVMDNFSESRMCYLKYLVRSCYWHPRGVPPNSMQQSDDADLEGSGDWADLLRPRQAEADEALRVGFSILGEPTLVPSKGIAVGTEPSFDAAVQSDGPLLDEEALSVLSARDAARITGFLRGLRDTRSGFDATTVEALLRLLKSLPAPDGPKILSIRSAAVDRDEGTKDSSSTEKKKSKNKPNKSTPKDKKHRKASSSSDTDRKSKKQKKVAEVSSSEEDRNMKKHRKPVEADSEKKEDDKPYLDTVPEHIREAAVERLYPAYLPVTEKLEVLQFENAPKEAAGEGKC